MNHAEQPLAADEDRLRGVISRQWLLTRVLAGAVTVSVTVIGLLGALYLTSP